MVRCVLVRKQNCLCIREAHATAGGKNAVAHSALRRLTKNITRK
jgi:hypothetical protein